MSRLYHNRFFAMGTRFHSVLPKVENEEGDRIHELLKKEVARIENKLSRFIPGSELSKVNKQARKKPITVDNELFEILNSCKYCWELTDGAFDVSLRPMMEYWKDQKNGSDCREDFSVVKTSLGMQKITLNAETRSVMFDNSMLEIDLGGFGKGYALEKVKNLLEKSAVNDAFISFGESSILALGEHPAGDSWKVGINDYLNPGSSIHEFKVKRGSVSTSSNFYVNDQGKLHNHKHVIDPETGMPHEEFTSVSVLAESPVLAEVMSTAFLTMSDEKIRHVKNRYDGMEVVRVNYESDEPKITKF